MASLTAALIVLGTLNVLTFLAFALDKWFAVNRRRRIPEAVLLQLSFLGGAPSAVLAINYLRHKPRKQHFRRRLKLIIVCQVVLVFAISVLGALA